MCAGPAWKRSTWRSPTRKGTLRNDPGSRRGTRHGDARPGCPPFRAPVPLRPARVSPEPPVTVLHPRTAGAVLGDLRLAVPRPHGQGGRRDDQHLGVLRPGDHHPRHHRRRVRQPGDLGDRPARNRRPETAAAIIAGRALTSVVVALGITALLLGIGWIFYRANVPGRTAPALAVTVIVGAISFCCLGFALASVIRNQDSAQPITQAAMLPLYFISGVFVAVSVLPRWLVDVAGVFPVRHLAAALLTAYNPHTTGTGFAGTDLLIVAAWGIGGLVIALWKFSWVPLSR